MAEWETINAWEAARGTQVLTARWLNRVIGNLDWVNAFASYGAVPFRSMRIRGTAYATYDTLWQGHFRHHNATATMVWSVWRGDSIAFDDDEQYGPRSDYMAEPGSPSTTRLQIHNGSDWQTIYEYNTTGAGTIGNVANETATAALGTLSLVPGGVYRLRVVGKNGGFEIARIHMNGGCAYAWGTIPLATDAAVIPIGTVATSGTPLAAPSPPGWNTYRHDVLYLKDVVDAPRGPTFGIYGRGGRNATNGKEEMAWRGWVKHRGDVLTYRIGTGHIGNGGCEAVLLYNGATVAIAPASNQGIDLRYDYVAGTCNLGTLSLTKGNWYEVKLKSASEDNSDFGVVLDYVAEFDGEPAGSIACAHWTHGMYVRGDSAGSNRITDIRAAIGNLKATADAYVQHPVPDLASDGGWGAVHAGTPELVRQRNLLYYGGNGGTLSLSWGTASTPGSVSLGAATAGTLDLRGVSGLNRNTNYWLSPKGSVTYTMEV